MSAKSQRAGKSAPLKLSRRKAAARKQRIPALFSKEWASLPVGHPKRWLALAGTLTHEEAEFLMTTVEDFEKVEEED